MKAKAAIRLTFSTEKQVETILKSLEIEADNPTSIRSHTTLQREGKDIVLKVEAKDTVALRATLNTYLRWINSILNVFKVLEA